MWYIKITQFLLQLSNHFLPISVGNSLRSWHAFYQSFPPNNSPQHLKNPSQKQQVRLTGAEVIASADIHSFDIMKGYRKTIFRIVHL